MVKCLLSSWLIECRPSKGISKDRCRADLPALLSLCKHRPFPECGFHWVQEFCWGIKQLGHISRKKAGVAWETDGQMGPQLG